MNIGPIYSSKSRNVKCPNRNIGQCILQKKKAMVSSDKNVHKNDSNGLAAVADHLAILRFKATPSIKWFKNLFN